MYQVIKTDGTEPALQRSALDILLGEEDTTEHDQSAGVSKSQEIETFFNQKAVPRAINPLQWWKNNCMSFPMMAKIAQSLLCTPATSTPSERVFSKAGLVVTKKRSNLKPSMVDSLITFTLNKNNELLK